MNDRHQKLQEVQDLCWKLLDEQMAPVEQARLNELLFGDPEACELYLNLATLHAHLCRDHGGEIPVVVPPAGLSETPHHPQPVVTSSARRSTFRRPSGWRIVRFAAAASVLLLVGAVAVLAWRGRDTPLPDACATIIETRGVEWAECSPSCKLGDRLEPSTVGLNKGTAVIRFDSGAVATLNGPAELRLESRKSAELKRGSVLVRAEKEASGFTLRTSASDYIDLGTEFGVSVNDDASSEVHVFEGVVIARPRASDLVVPVLRNEAGRVEADRGDLVSIDASTSKFPGVSTVSLPRPDLATRPAATAGGQGYAAIPRDARIIFLGDRATDLETHLLLINQSFNRMFDSTDHPQLFNAGEVVPLAFDEAQIRQFVLAFKPTFAVLEFGPEIASGGNRRPVDRFETEVRRLLDRLTAEGIEPILSTGFKLGERQAQCQGVLDDYNRVLRKVAAEKGYRLADVDEHFRALEKFKMSLVAPNGAIPTFNGYREISSVLLSAMGFANVKVPPTLDLALLPGVITKWQYRVKAPTALLDAAHVAQLAPDQSWKELSLPQREDMFVARVADSTHSATYRDRERGFATNLCDRHTQMIEAVANIESSEPREAYINTGACIRSVWLNGEKVYENPGHWTGWHPGKDRLPVMLQPGNNEIVVEAGGAFFLSVTDRFDWPVQ